jgi:hypothetical protein
MNPQDVDSSREYIVEHTNRESLLKNQPPAASPKYVSQVTWGQNQVKTFLVKDKFPVKHKQE